MSHKLILRPSYDRELASRVFYVQAGDVSASSFVRNQIDKLLTTCILDIAGTL